MKESHEKGNIVEVIFNSTTGAVRLKSNGGTLMPDWLEKAGIPRDYVKSIRISSGKVYLPEDASGSENEDTDFKMFGGLQNVHTIDLRKFDTSRVTNMRAMFESCYNLKALDLTGLDTSNVTDLSQMFRDCHA